MRRRRKPVRQMPGRRLELRDGSSLDYVPVSVSAFPVFDVECSGNGVEQKSSIAFIRLPVRIVAA